MLILFLALPGCTLANSPAFLPISVHHRNVKTRIPQGSFPIQGIEELEMPEIEEAEEVDNAFKVATMAASSTSSGEETLKEEEDTIVKSPKVEKRVPQVPHFRGQQRRDSNANPVPVVNKVVENGKKSKEKKEEGKKRRKNEKKPKQEPESESEYSSDKSSSDTLSSSPPRRHRRGHQRRDQGRSQSLTGPSKMFYGSLFDPSKMF